MSSYSSLIVFLIILVYFLYNTIRTFKKRKKLYSKGPYISLNYFTIGFYVYILCDIILLIYLLYNFRDLDLFEIIMGIIFIIFIFISSYINTKVTIAKEGLNYMYFYIDYKNLTDVRIQKYKGDKYLVGFFNKQGKMIFSLKLKEDKMKLVKDFLSNKKVQIYTI